MSCTARLFIAAAFVLNVGAPALFAAEPAPAAAKTYTAKAEPLRIELTVGGVFECERMTEVSRIPKAWAQMKVLWAAEPGAVVKKGAPLVKLDTEDLDQKIKDIEAGDALAALALKQAEEELRLLEATTPDQLAWARRTKKVADENLDFYLKQDWPYKKQYLSLDKQWTEIWLEGIRTEFAELKKMYEADDMVEGTEELVLKRQKYALDRAVLGNERSFKFHFTWREKIEEPRQLEEQQKSAQDAALALRQAETTLPLALERKRLELQKIKYDRARAQKTLEDLKADKATMTVLAPADGIVYYGRNVCGQWPGAAAVAQKLQPGGQLVPYEAFITIVEPAGLRVRAGVAEKDLCDLHKGVAARIAPTAYPEQKLTGEVESVVIALASPQPYAVTISVRGKQDRLLPGMTCKVRLLVYEKEKAILVPAKSVFSEASDEDQRFVYVLPADGKEPVKRPVTAGRQQGEKIEIVKGIEEGDVIVLEKPENR